jgi:transcription initiation factor IIE alpha subunit
MTEIIPTIVQGLTTLIQLVPTHKRYEVESLQRLMPMLETEIHAHERRAKLLTQEIEDLKTRNADLVAKAVQYESENSQMAKELDKHTAPNMRPASFTDDTDEMVILIDSNPRRNWTEEELAQKLQINIVDVRYHTDLLTEHRFIEFDLVNRARQFNSPGLKCGHKIKADGVKYSFALRQARQSEGATTEKLIQAMPSAVGAEFTERELSQKVGISLQQAQAVISKFCDARWVRPASTAEPGYETRFELTGYGREQQRASVKITA